MKNLTTIILLFVFLFLVNNTQAQFLRKDIYTFEVGDYYDVEYWASKHDIFTSFSFVWFEDLYLIQSRNYNFDSSIASYTAQRQRYSQPLNLPDGSFRPESLIIDTVSFFHMNLNDSFSLSTSDQTFGTSWGNYGWTDFSIFNCFTVDSLISAYPCQSLNLFKFDFHIYYPTPSTFCFPTIAYSNYVVEKAGGPYGTIWYEDPGTLINNRFLVFFKKGNSVCGNVNSHFVGVGELETNNLTIYPQPSSTHFYIQSDLPIENIEIYDVSGKLLFSELKLKVNKIDCSQWPHGIYMLHVKTSDNIEIVRKVQKI